MARVDAVRVSSSLSLCINTLFLLFAKVLSCKFVCATDAIRKSPFASIWRFLFATTSDPSIAMSLPATNFKSPSDTRCEPLTDSEWVCTREELAPCQVFSEFVLNMSDMSLTAATLIEPPATILAWWLLVLPKVKWLPSMCVSLPLVILVFLPTEIELPCCTLISALPMPPKRSNDFWSWVSTAPIFILAPAAAWKFPPMSTFAPAIVKPLPAWIRASWLTLMLATGSNCVCRLYPLAICWKFVWDVVTKEMLPPACISNCKACSFALVKSISFPAASNIFLPLCKTPNELSKLPSLCRDRSWLACKVPAFLKFWMPVNWMFSPATKAPSGRLLTGLVCAKYTCGTNARETVPSVSVTSCWTNQTMSEVNWDICSAVSAMPNVSCVDLASVTPLAIKSAYCFWLSE